MPFPTSSFVQAGRFTDVRPIGQGACGLVYAAKDNLGRAVAVKEALPSQEEFHTQRAKFHNEARIQAQLQHPNVIAVYQLEEDSQTQELYLICEYANGGSLADHLHACGTAAEAQAIMVALDICAALEATWSQQIVHRDIKPSNILLVKSGQGQITSAKLGDFGIAQDQKRRRTTLLPGAGHPGTPLYMPPEQTQIASLLDVRADLYALGVTLWEMLTGHDYKLLLTSGAPLDLASYSQPSSPGVAAVIQRAVQEDRAQRYTSPQDLARELAEVRDGTWVPVRSTIVLRQPAPNARGVALAEPQSQQREAFAAREEALARPQQKDRAHNAAPITPAPPANRAGQRVATLGVIFSSFAVLVSSGLWVTLDGSGPPRPISLFFALAAAAMLMVVARWQRISTFACWWQLVGGGFAGVLGITRAFAPGLGLWQVFGLLVALAGLIAIRLALAKDAQP
ncbi:MAG: serine/threonine-protein kinase [Roseiflexaceae bacterium]